jgi:hypothetical protein
MTGRDCVQGNCGTPARAICHVDRGPPVIARESLERIKRGL